MKRRDGKSLVVLALILAFLVGRSFGIAQAKHSYEQLIGKYEELVENLQERIQIYEDIIKDRKPKDNSSLTA